MALALTLLVSLPGCGREVSMTPVFYNTPVERVELVRGPMDRDQWQEELGLLWREHEERPPKSVGLTGTVLDWSRGARSYAVVTRGGDGIRVQLLGEDLQVLSTVEGIPAPPPGVSNNRMGAQVAYDPKGATVALAVQYVSDSKVGGDRERVTHVGVVEPSDGIFRELAVLQFGSYLQGWFRGSLVVVGYDESAGQNRVLLVDAGDGSLEEAATGPRQVGTRMTNMPVLYSQLSPDGSLLAFSMRFDSSLPESGVWLVSLEAGTCTEVTVERAGWYNHELVCWDSSRTFLFGRMRRADGKWELWRAHLAAEVKIP